MCWSAIVGAMLFPQVDNLFTSQKLRNAPLTKVWSGKPLVGYPKGTAGVPSLVWQDMTRPNEACHILPLFVDSFWGSKRIQGWFMLIPSRPKGQGSPSHHALVLHDDPWRSMTIHDWKDRLQNAPSSLMSSKDEPWISWGLENPWKFPYSWALKWKNHRKTTETYRKHHYK